MIGRRGGGGGGGRNVRGTKFEKERENGAKIVVEKRCRREREGKDRFYARLYTGIYTGGRVEGRGRIVDTREGEREGKNRLAKR